MEPFLDRIMGNHDDVSHAYWLVGALFFVTSLFVESILPALFGAALIVAGEINVQGKKTRMKLDQLIKKLDPAKEEK